MCCYTGEVVRSYLWVYRYVWYRLFTPPVHSGSGADPGTVSNSTAQMGSNDDSRGTGWYMHTNYEESQVLAGRVIAAIGRHRSAEDLFKLVDGVETSGENATEKAASATLANRFLYGILLDQIKNTLLIAYLQTNHLNKGKDALNYVIGCFKAGDDVNKLEAALGRYLDILENGIPEDASTDEANAIITELTNCRGTLEAATDDTYHMPAGLHSRMMVRLVKKRGKPYADELRLQRASITTDMVKILEVPTADTMTAAMRVLRYLVSTKELGLRWTVGADTVLSGMSDSNWAVVKSTSGYVFFLAQAAVAYVSKKQASIAMSSTEAEIMAASLAALEAVFLRGLLSELDCVQESPTVLGVDNQGAIALAKNYVSNSRTKHIERRHLKIRELVKELAVRPEFVPTDENVADILSKPLGREKFEKFRRVLLNHEV